MAIPARIPGRTNQLATGPGLGSERILSKINRFPIRFVYLDQGRTLTALLVIKIQEVGMRKVTVFNFITLDGYFKGPKGDISWHRHGPEENEYAAENLKYGGTLLFGRVTYEMMASYWPTPDAIKNDPIVAEGMNNADKIVFSRKLKKVEWNNTRLVKENIVEEIKKMKQQPGKDMTVLGSGSILTQFAEQDLIDEYQIMVDPVVLGDGTPIVKGIKHRLDLKLTGTRTFKSGVVLFCYQPVVKEQ
jgi:dihydrofolate reductase